VFVSVTAEDGDVAAAQNGTAIFGNVTLAARVGHTGEVSNQGQHQISYPSLERLDELGLPLSKDDSRSLGGSR
jgi:hypothetical protein